MLSSPQRWTTTLTIAGDISHGSFHKSRDTVTNLLPVGAILLFLSLAGAGSHDNSHIGANGDSTIKIHWCFIAGHSCVLADTFEFSDQTSAAPAELIVSNTSEGNQAADSSNRDEKIWLDISRQGLVLLRMKPSQLPSPVTMITTL